MDDVLRPQAARSEGLNVAFVVNNYPPRTGGVELHVQALGRELVRTGHEVTVITLGSEVGWSEDRGIKVLTLSELFRVADILGFPLPGTRRKLTRLLKSRKIDVVSVHTRFFPMSFIGWRAARTAGTPVIHTEHGSGHVASNSAFIRLASRAVDFTLGRRVLRGANQVLGVSEAVVDFVRRLAGVEAQIFYNAIAASERSVDIKSRAHHLVFVGRIVPGKGWDIYLEAVARLRDMGHKVTGAVLGDGSDFPALLRSVRASGLQDAIDVRGRVTQEEVRSELRGATLVNPTTLSEGFQTTLLESIAEGGNVVTYPVPGAKTLSEAGAPVLVTDERSGDALVGALHQVLLAPPAPAPVKFIDAWTWQTRATQFVEIAGNVLVADER